MAAQAAEQNHTYNMHCIYMTWGMRTIHFPSALSADNISNPIGSDSWKTSWAKCVARHSLILREDQNTQHNFRMWTELNHIYTCTMYVLHENVHPIDILC